MLVEHFSRPLPLSLLSIRLNARCTSSGRESRPRKELERHVGKSDRFASTSVEPLFFGVLTVVGGTEVSIPEPSVLWLEALAAVGLLVGRGYWRNTFNRRVIQ